MLQVQVDQDFHDALKHFATIASELQVRWLMIGATARMLLLEKIYGWSPGLATEDTDFAVWIENWEQYRVLCERLEAAGSMASTQKPAKRFRTRGDRNIDLLPYGGVEENNKQVFWPPHRDSLMTVRGFNGAARTAITVRVNGETDVQVASPPGLMALKLFAWEERHTQQVGRDAKDIAYLFRNVEKLYPMESLYEVFPEIVEKFDYDPEHAAIGALARDVMGVLDAEEKHFMTEFVGEQAAGGETSALVRELHRYLPVFSVPRVSGMVAAFFAGFG